MRPRVAYHRDTLNARRLPRDEPTYLDYRTRINPVAFDNKTTLRLIVVCTVLLVPLAVLGRLAAGWSTVSLTVAACIAGGFLTVGAIKTAFMGKLAVQMAWGAIGVVAIGVAVLMRSFADPRAAFFGLISPALLQTATFAFFAGKQTAFWMTANHRVDQQTMFRWRRPWSFAADPEDRELCPQLLTIPIVLVAVPIGCLAGFAALHFLSSAGPSASGGVFALAVTLAVVIFAWIAAHVVVGAPLRSPFPSLVAAWRSIRIFATYNRHDTPAAGVFRFPTEMVQSVALRDFFLGSTLTMLSFSLVALILLPPEPRALATLWRSPERRSVVLADHEWDTFRSLPYNQAQAYMQKLTAERKAELRAVLEREARSSDRHVAERVVFTIIVATFGPPVLLLLMVALVSGSTVAHYYQALEKPDAPGHSPLTIWQVLVDRLINSPNKVEARHYFLGSSLYHDYPVLLDEEILSDHGHILGDTGARKTSMGIAPLATQLIAKKRSVLMLDLKGEPALFHGLRSEAQRAGVPFKWFTTTPTWSSYVFNPFLQANWQRFTSSQRVQIILTALSLDYGVDYGRAFFTAMNETVLADLIRKRPMESFEDIYEVLSRKEVYQTFGNILDWEKARHLIAIVNRLRMIHPLNLTPKSLPDRPEVFQNAIDLSDLLREPQVVYFFLKAPLEPLGTAGVAKLALYSLFAAAADTQIANKSRTFVLIDEFQQIISNSIELVLEQGRSLGTSFVLSHQTKGQTKRGGVDIQETVESCTAYKHNYRASDLRSILEFEQLSGQGMYHRFTWRQAAPVSDDDEEDVGPAFSTLGDVTVTETTGPLMERNLIMELSADEQGSIVRFTKDSGYTRFGGKATPILSDFHIEKREFEDLQGSEFPKVSSDTVEVQPDFGNPTDVTPKVQVAGHGQTLLPDGSDPDERLRDLR